MKYAMFSAIIVAALLLAKPALGEELVAEFSGERSMRTGEFAVEAPWILEWRVTGDYARDMAVDASLVEATTSAHQGNVLKARAQGNGVRLFRESGKFFFRVDSTLAGWSLRAIQLTEEEAELYTPRGGTRLDY
ncbi:MAG TPA: hypothetical protein VMN03_16505 [Burkholderiales bacterium]|nr:hypothetical protein [Burkholderiales bacterium]